MALSQSAVSELLEAFRRLLENGSGPTPLPRFARSPIRSDGV
jgi:hypothetical protein